MKSAKVSSGQGVGGSMSAPGDKLPSNTGVYKLLHGVSNDTRGRYGTSGCLRGVAKLSVSGAKVSSGQGVGGSMSAIQAPGDKLPGVDR